MKKMRSRGLGIIGALWAAISPGAEALAAPAAAAAPAAGAPAAAAPAARLSEAGERQSVGLTVYNGDFALVREVRRLGSLPNGRVALEFRDVASTIQPETVAVRTLGQAGAFRVLEQNYRFDLLTPETLLDKYVGRSVRAYRYHEGTGKEDVVDAKLLSVANGPVLMIGSEITFNYPGRLAFSELPPNLIAKPTLVWLVENRTPEQTLEVSYLARGMSWSADYVLVLAPGEKQANLVGWVTLVNNSGSSYRGAKLELVAGDVNRVAPQAGGMMVEKSRRMAEMAQQSFTEQSLMEYHLYGLDRPTDVLDREQKQVTLLEANGIGVQKKLVFSGQPYWYQGQYGELGKNQKVSVFLEFDNTQQNRLGLPLPKGTLRVYAEDQSRAKQFVGEDAIDHTPRDEHVRIKVGEAFDVVADRKQERWSALGQCSSESTWSIELRNHKDEDVSVEVREPAGGDWTIVDSSHPAVRDNAQQFHFDVPVPKRGKAAVKYRVRVRWC